MKYSPDQARRRLRRIFIGFAIMLSLFAGRLVQLQVVQAPAYATTAQEQSLRTQTIQAVRGTITDANGVVLATTVQAVNVTADQTLVTDPLAEAEQMAPIVNVSVSVLQSRLTGTHRFAYIVKDATPQMWREVNALNLPGIFSEQTQQRIYPDGELAADVMGFVGSDGSGLGGLEYSLNSQLAGQNGTETYQVGGDGEEIPTGDTTTKPVVPGEGIELTINRDIQYIAQKEIAAEVKASNSDSGTVVVEDAQSGQILALATAPTFDPNDPAAASPSNRGNRALSDIYEPGSTSKIMTVAAAIDSGKVTPATKLTVPNSLTRGGKAFHDDVSHGIWHLTLTGMLARSSNLGAILTAEKIGGNTLYSYLKKFGIGDYTGLNFPGESRGLITAPNQWSNTSFYTMAFGQGLSLNAVQATSVYATIANNGVRVTPSLVKGYTSSTGQFTAAPAPTTSRVVSANTATEVRNMLESVVSDQGTAPLAEIAGYNVAGKTGTANRVDPTCGCYRGYTASFIGMAPADKPQLVVSVVLQNPKGAHYGGQLAAPVFHTVMSFALETLKIAPTGTPPARLKLTW